MRHVFLPILVAGAVAWCACAGAGEDRIALDATAFDAPSGCNPFESLGCALGEKCTFRHAPDTSLQVPQCAPVGNRGDDESCAVAGNGFDDCAAKLFCVDAVCRGICGIPGYPCMQGYCEIGDGFKTCLPPCDPLAPDCADGLVCYPPRMFRDLQTPACAPPGATPEGSSCSDPHDCEPGAGCDVGTCVRLCAVAGDDCMPGEVCQEWSPGAAYGQCVPAG